MHVLEQAEISSFIYWHKRYWLYDAKVTKRYKIPHLGSISATGDIQGISYLFIYRIERSISLMFKKKKRPKKKKTCFFPKCVEAPPFRHLCCLLLWLPVLDVKERVKVWGNVRCCRVYREAGGKNARGDNTGTRSYLITHESNALP